VDLGYFYSAMGLRLTEDAGPLPPRQKAQGGTSRAASILMLRSLLACFNRAQQNAKTGFNLH
jgi:hypothetical protein